MFRLLIVDDEPMTVEALYALLSDRLQDDVAIAKTDSGVKAMEMIRSERFDLVLTDIRMPEISGLELAAELASRWPETHLIFLTGYGEFEPVYQAIRYAHVSYLLKIEGHEKIAQEVIVHLQAIAAERRSEQILLRAQEHLKNALPLLQRDMLKKLLDGLAPDGLQDKFEQLNLPFSAERDVILLCVRASELSSVEESTRIVGLIHTIVERFLPESKTVLYLYGCLGDLMVWILQPPLGNSTIQWEIYVKGMLAVIQEAAAQVIEGDVSLGMSRPSSWTETAEALLEIKQLLYGPLATEQHLALALSDLPERDESIQTARRVDLAMGRLNLLSIYLERNDEKEFMERLEGLIRHALKGSWLPPHNQTVQLAIALFFNNYLAIQSLQCETGLAASPFLSTFSEAVRAYGQATRFIINAQKKSLSHWQLNAIEQVCRYIDAHLSEDLSLIRLADRFHFNPKYLSRLFKQKVSSNLSDYINQRRLELAIRLLSDSHYKVLEVGRKVGFESAPYFTRFFKRYMGMSPQSYRENLRK